MGVKPQQLSCLLSQLAAVPGLSSHKSIKLHLSVFLYEILLLFTEIMLEASRRMTLSELRHHRK